MAGGVRHRAGEVVGRVAAAPDRHGLEPAPRGGLAQHGAEALAGIARRFGVALSTVRTQISSIRQKTRSSSLRALVRQVALLPPIVSVLSHTRTH